MTDSLNPPATDDNFLDSLDKNLEAAFAEEDPLKAPPPTPAPAPTPTPATPPPAPKNEDPHSFVPADDGEQEWWKEKKAGEAFSQIKAEAKAARDRLAALEKELEEAKGTAGRVSELEKSLTEKETRLAAYDIQSTPTYQNEVSNPLKALVNQAEELGGRELVEALGEPNIKKRNEQISRIVEGQDLMTQQGIRDITMQVDVVMSKREKLIKNAETELKRIQEQEALSETEAKAQARKVYGQAVDTVLGKLEDRLSFLKDKDTGGLTKKAEEMLARVRNTDFDKSSPVVRAFAALAGEALPTLLGQIASRDKEIADLKSQLSKFNGAIPGAGAGSQPHQNNQPNLQGGGGFMDSVEQQIREAGGNMSFGEG